MIDPRLSQALKLIAEVVADQEQAAPAPKDDQLLKLDQLAARLNSHPQTVRALMAEGMPHMVLGRAFRFDLAKVQAWLTARASPTKPVELKPITPKPEPRTDLGLGDDVGENPFADFD